ncbi:hypothetical protein E4T56_gene3494 [Termitomyces sp. T112]|nr:hypothetical protein E4T56_gene3494 [Termitomyces sp. T112]
MQYNTLALQTHTQLRLFVDRDTFVQFTGGGIGHCTTRDATCPFQEDIEKGFLLNENSSTYTDNLETQYQEESTSESEEEEDPYEEIPEENEEMSEEEDEENEDENNLFDDFLGYAGFFPPLRRSGFGQFVDRAKNGAAPGNSLPSTQRKQAATRSVTAGQVPLATAPSTNASLPHLAASTKGGGTNKLSASSDPQPALEKILSIASLHRGVVSQFVNCTENHPTPVSHPESEHFDAAMDEDNQDIVNSFPPSRRTSLHRGVVSQFVNCTENHPTPVSHPESEHFDAAMDEDNPFFGQEYDTQYDTEMYDNGNYTMPPAYMNYEARNPPTPRPTYNLPQRGPRMRYARPHYPQGGIQYPAPSQVHHRHPSAMRYRPQHGPARSRGLFNVGPSHVPGASNVGPSHVPVSSNMGLRNQTFQACSDQDWYGQEEDNVNDFNMLS